MPEISVADSTALMTGHGRSGAGRMALSYLLWPGLLAAALAGTAYVFNLGLGIAGFNMVYLIFAFAICATERVMPHERAWLENDGQTFANLAHTLFSKGLVQVVIKFSAVVGLASVVRDDGSYGALWPGQLPFPVQIIFALIISEIGLYWAHRLAHEWSWLWRFHAIHHSVTRLWFINTGRFHIVDSLVSIIAGSTLLFLLAAPIDIFYWVSAVTAFIGMLTHCNIEMRFGWLNYVFNTPGLHRWHHSMIREEGDKNYGENLMLWDQLFGTFFNGKARRPPAKIGIDDYMPANFLGQLANPFTKHEPAARR